MRAFRWAAVMVVAVLLLGCAMPPKVPFDRTAGDVKSIGIITPSFPDSPTVVLASTVGQSFGLIGGLIDAAMQADREAKFKGLLEEQKFSTQDRFVEFLVKDLQATGYTVSMIPAKREGNAFAKQYPTDSPSKVDAYLDLVTLRYGYVAAGVGSSTPYRPFFIVQTRLVSARDSSLLMQDNVIYNSIRPGGDEAITIAPDPAYGFANFDALMGDPKTATTGLQIAAEQSAQAIGKLLR